MNAMTPEMESLKTRLQATWMAGDYGHFAKYLEPGALEFLSRISIEPGVRSSIYHGQNVDFVFFCCKKVYNSSNSATLGF